MLSLWYNLSSILHFRKQLENDGVTLTLEDMFVSNFYSVKFTHYVSYTLIDLFIYIITNRLQSQKLPV